MARKTKDEPTQSGGGRLKSQGRKLLWVHVSEAQHKILRRAAAEEGVAVSELVTRFALEGAGKILEKAQNST